MAKNDIVLLDSLVEKSRARLPIKDDSELFELFSFDQILKIYEPSIEELESGWTDGGNDGGIDGFFIYVDGRVATPNISNSALRKNPVIELHIISCKRTPRFEQQPIDLACTRFRRHRVRCFDGTGGGSWRGGSLHASSSLKRCG